jgi:hypothetical protein
MTRRGDKKLDAERRTETVRRRKKKETEKPLSRDIL